MGALLYGEALVDDFGTEQVVGGAPFNVARHLAAFMDQPLLITRLGNDKNGAIVRAEFERFAMSTAGVQTDDMEETGRVIVQRGPEGHEFAILPRQAYDFIRAEEAFEAVARFDASVFYFGTLAQRGARSAETLHNLLKAVGGTRFLDLNLRPGFFDELVVTASIEAADIVKVNEAELQFLFRWYFQVEPEEQLAADEVHSFCAALLDRFGLEALIVTLGHRGSVYFGADGQTIANRDNPVPPYVIDTVGAGDAYSAIFLYGRLHGWPLEQTLARANEFAGAICAIPGAVPRELGFYDSWVSRWR
ncbi:MAG: PfkB family carbohydrate kinase [Pseudomonadota bacterium]